MEPIPNHAARRLLLAGQGLLDDPAQRDGSPAHVQRVIEQLGFVQIDSINIIERAHHHILLTRIADYAHESLRTVLERDHSVFEHWTHDASIIPAQWFPHWKRRFARYRTRIRENRWWNERLGGEPERVLAQVRDFIAAHGPLRSRDVRALSGRDGDDPAANGNGAWWGWSPAKAALEYLWRSGELMIAKRERFEKVYDLTGRVLGEAAAQPEPEDAAHIDWACRAGLERLGAATPGELAAFMRAITPAEARAWCDHALHRGEIVPVEIESAGDQKPRTAIAFADWRERLAALGEPPPRVDDMRLLSPFDPLIRDRARLQRLFGFDYRFEAFVPAPKRQYGYYVLPMLAGDRLLGRVLPRFDRKARELVIEQVWWEPGVHRGLPGGLRTAKQRRTLLETAVNSLAVGIGAAWWSLAEA